MANCHRPGSSWNPTHLAFFVPDSPKHDGERHRWPCDNIAHLQLCRFREEAAGRFTLHGARVNRLTSLTAGGEPYTFLPHRPSDTLEETIQGMDLPCQCSEDYSRWVQQCRSARVTAPILQGCPLINLLDVEQSSGQPFEVLAPDSRYVFVSSPEHIKEVETAPEDVLSLYAASQQVLQPQYTMHGFNWYEKPTEGVGFVRALRTLLTNNLPEILPNLGVVVRERFAELRDGYPVVNGVWDRSLS
jgi:hypothetical protein